MTRRTWTDKEEMRRGSVLMLQGNPYFAWQIGDGTYRPCRDVGQLEQFRDDIFAGVKTAGFYAIRPDNLTRWGGIDYDAHGSVANQHWRDAAQRAFDLLAPQFAESWLVESSPGGFHVFIFGAELAPARDIRAKFKACAPAEVEAFPKQDELDADDWKAKGSLLRFPGKHQLKKRGRALLPATGAFRRRRGTLLRPNRKLANG